MRILKKFALPALAGCLLALMACDTQVGQVGFGPSIDLTIPRAAITSPANRAYLGSSFTLTGTCADNVGVSSATITLVPMPAAATADIVLGAGNTSWTASVAGLTDGDYQVEVRVKDSRGNTSDTAIINVTVDTQSPTAIISNPPLQPRTNLVALGTTKSITNMPLFQNGTFQLKGTCDDNAGLQSVTIQLLDDNGNDVYYLDNTAQTLLTIQAGMTSYSSNPGDLPMPSGVTGTIYSWTVNIDTGLLRVGGQPLDPATPYYFKIKITTVDKTGIIDVKQPADATKPGYLCVWGDSARPWAESISTGEGNVVPAGGVISGSMLAPRGVSKIYLKVVKQSDWLAGISATAYTSWGSDPEAQVVDLSAINPLPVQTAWSVTVPAAAQLYRLLIQAEDAGGHVIGQTVGGVDTPIYQTRGFQILDLNAPVTVVETPTDQTVSPATGTGDFAVTGYSYDNVAVQSLQVAWVPYGQDLSVLTGATVPAIWATALSQTTGNSTTPYVDPATKIRILNLTPLLTSTSGKPDVPASFPQWGWTRTFNVETDFQISGTPEYKDHRLVFLTRDDSGNATYNRLTLLGENVTPAVTETSLGSDGLVRRSVAPLSVFTLGGSVSDNGGIQKVEVLWSNGGVTKTATLNVNGTWLLDSDNFNLTTGPQNFQIIATDKYGNKGYASRFVQVDNDSPGILGVSSNSPDSAYNAGKALGLIVQFNKPVTVTGSPRIALNSGAGVYATYSSGSGTSSLTFAYTVAAGQNSADLDAAATTSLTLNGGTIADSVGNTANLTLPVPGAAGSLSYNKNLVIDTAAPGISAYSPTQGASGAAASTNIVLTFSEPVYRESGNISLIRLYKRYPVLIPLTDYQFKYYGSSLQSVVDANYTLSSNGSTAGVPNTAGVYVLNYSIDANDQTKTALLNFGDSIGYNRIDVPVDSTQVSGSGTSTITINLSSDLAIGTDWYINIDSTCFRDQVGNSFAGISDNSTYRFSTGPVATPIIRINKTSGADTTQPSQTTFKISSETEGASLYYTLSEVATTTSNPTLPTAPADPTAASSSFTANVNIPTTALTQNDTAKGAIIRIKALATKTGLTASAVTEEIAFKTILSTNYNAGSNYIWYRGSNNSGGPTTAPGFPLRWEDNMYTYIKLAANSSNRWYWITWEISVANVGASPVAAQYKALVCDKPTDWATMGPLNYGWESGSNKQVFAGGYSNLTPASFEAWNAHQRP